MELGIFEPRQNHVNGVAVDPVEAIARAKSIPVDALLAFGVHDGGRCALHKTLIGKLFVNALNVAQTRCQFLLQAGELDASKRVVG